VQRAADGEFAAIFVAGESGVGKSRLVGQAVASVRARDGLVLIGECVSLTEGELPYAPLRAALRGIRDELEPDELAELSDPGREALARLLPDLVGEAIAAPTEASPLVPSTQVRLFEVVLGLLGRLGSRTPVLLVIEDIHWADPSTLAFLAFLLANARKDRLALVCTYRSDELHRRHPLREFLAHSERPPAERIALARFTRGEMSEQLRGILGSDPDAALVNRLFERTEGNAFFVEELFAASAGAGELPGSLRDALLLRVERLPDSAQDTVRRAAVHGRFIPHRLLAAISDLPEDELGVAVREAVAHHVLVARGDDGYAFRHALLQETIELDQLPGERSAMNLRLAEALAADPTLGARDGKVAAELCAHWLGAHRVQEALAASIQAGAEAEEVFAHADAAHHYERALELWTEGGGQECAGIDEEAVYVRAAEALYLSGSHSNAIRMIEVAAARVDPRADPYGAALLRERLGRYRWISSGNTDQALAAHREALDLLPADAPGPEGARVLAGLAQILMLRGEIEECEALSERAVEVARRTGNRAAEAHALNTFAVMLTWRGQGEAAISTMRESLRISEEVNSLDDVMRGHFNLSEVFDQHGRVHEAARTDMAGVERARELELRDWTRNLEAEASTRFFKLGDLDKVDELTSDALELQPSMGMHTNCGARARMAIYRNDREAAERLVEAFERTKPSSLNITAWVEPNASAEVELELLRQSPEDALRVGEAALERAAEGEQIPYTARLYGLVARAAAEAAERARAGGRAEVAAELADRAAARLQRFDRLLASDRWRGHPGPELLAWRETCATEVRRAEGVATAADWEAVVELWSERDFPLEEAYARERQTECSVIAGDRDGAQSAALRGLELARRCGAVWLEQSLESLTRRGRLAVAEPAANDSPPDDAVDRLGLTARELEVLELVATGLTNRQIGEQLFMAEKTASVHVSRILSKLDVGSRVEAATAAQRLGIVP
jgi:ATP/maltotriose-dependent transcriptional regulator MalT